MNTTITEMSTLEGINKKIEDGEVQVCEMEDRIL